MTLLYGLIHPWVLTTLKAAETRLHALHMVEISEFQAEVNDRIDTFEGLISAQLSILRYPILVRLGRRWTHYGCSFTKRNIMSIPLVIPPFF